MSQEQFATVSQDFLECYPSLKVKAKLQRIYHICKELDGLALTQVLNAIIDTSRGVPTPDDIRTAVNSWKRTFYNKNGRAYGYDSAFDAPSTNDCIKCEDLGIVLGTKHDSLDQILFKCSCIEAKSNTAKLPEWDYSLSPVYKKTKCPLEWFKPDFYDGKNFSAIEKTIINKFNQWKVRLKKSEDHWANLGFVA